jgi:hypothetical protein
MPKRLVVVFFLVHLLLAGYFSDYRPLVNPTSRALPVVSLVEQGSLEITALHRFTIDKARIGDRYYSDKAPLASFVVVPFYAALHATGAVREVGTRLRRVQPVFLLGNFLCGALPFALIMTLTLVALLRAPSESKIPQTVLASLPFYGSFLFVYAGSFYGHLLAALLLLLSWIAVRPSGAGSLRDGIGGALVGLAVLAEYPAALVLPVWALHLWRARPAPLRSLLAFGAGGLPMLVLLLAYNAQLTGSPFVSPYELEASPDFEAMQQGFGIQVPALGEFLAALWGLLLSPFRGLAVYAPVTLLLAAVCFSEIRWRALLHPLVQASIVYVGVMACYYLWWGGTAYGPRHLIPPVALLMFAGAGVLARRLRRPWIFYGLGLIGLLCAVLAKMTVGPRLEAEYTNPLWQVVLPNALAGAFQPFNFASLWGGVMPDSALALWAVVFTLSMAALARFERHELGS